MLHRSVVGNISHFEFKDSNLNLPASLPCPTLDLFGLNRFEEDPNKRRFRKNYPRHTWMCSRGARIFGAEQQNTVRRKKCRFWMHYVYLATQTPLSRALHRFRTVRSRNVF